MICPFKATPDQDFCPDCGAPYSGPDMLCGLDKVVTLIPGAPITAGKAEVCDPSDGVCTSCE